MLLFGAADGVEFEVLFDDDEDDGVVIVVVAELFVDVGAGGDPKVGVRLPKSSATAL